MSDEVNAKATPFNALSEGCIAHIISVTSPEDACRVAAVSHVFKSAADSDAAWERFLPNEIVSRVSSPVEFSTKKQLFMLLRRSPLFLDRGKLSFGLSESGKKRYLMSAKALQIGGIDNPHHWEWTSLEKSNFTEVAKLRSINRLEIRGIMPGRMLSPNTHYFVWLKYMFTEIDDGLDVPAKASIKFVKEDGSVTEGETSTVYLVEPRNRDDDGRLSWALYDDWYGMELGEIAIGEGDSFDIHIEVSETERLNQKKGLIIEGIEFSPTQKWEKLQVAAFASRFFSIS